MKKLLFKFVIVWLLLLPLPGFAVSAAVDAPWVLANLKAPGIVFLDIQEPDFYRRFHVPGAVNAPYSKWRTSGKGPQRGMLPPVKQLESMIGALGIGNDDTVVIVATGRDAGDLAAAARVFWTFRALGHEQVAILDGGLVVYAEAAGDRKLLASGTESRDARTFTAKPVSGIVADAGSTRALLKDSGELVDARSPGEYMGIYSGGEGERPGTIPGAKNLPYDWLTDNGSARLRDLESLKLLYESLGVDTSGEQVHFCHTGNRAALTWFVSYALFGNDKASLYDASMLEWARRTDLPVEPKIKLCREC